MTKIDYKIGCSKCGRYIEVKMELGFFDMAKFQMNDLQKDVEELCICNKAWDMRKKNKGEQ